ncbi:hypothetical protein [Solimonas variicoloris]|uniref:hypothetical protein n=1 Tax=Solimonas variicoloris TaxID=254408 RepID=UPI00037D7119|nr:hypothetical protein [Solimonas variicoloris]
MRKVIGTLFLLTATVCANAGTCEEGFQTIGDARNGLLFVAQVQLPGLRAESALGQLQQLALDGGYEVGGELIRGNAGELSFLQTSNHPAVVVRATAGSDGQISLSMKLAAGQTVKEEAVRTEFCSILGKLNPGREGEAIASAARAKTRTDQFIDVKAETLSADVGRDVKNTLAPVASIGRFSKFLIGTGPSATSKDYEDAFAPMRAKYVGKKYRIDGQIYTVSQNRITGEMELAYLVTKTRGLLGIRQESSYNDLNFAVTCVLAADQAKLFATLNDGNWIKLMGTVTAIQPGGMKLADCRQAT